MDLSSKIHIVFIELQLYLTQSASIKPSRLYKSSELFGNVLKSPNSPQVRI